MPAVQSPEGLRAEFVTHFGGKAGCEPRLFRAPGRINIIGEHTDYTGGYVLPATIDLHTWVAARPRDDRLLHVRDCGSGELHCLDLDELVRGEAGQPIEYIKAVAWALQQDGLRLTGCDVAITGNIPLGGGLSSSASLELSLACALLDCAGISVERRRLALLCQRAESEFVGARCGIMDQYVISMGAPSSAMLLDCRSLEFDLVDIPPGLKFLLIHSGVSHRVSTGSYNSRQDECGEALRRLEVVIPGLESLRDLTERQLSRYGDRLDELLFRRCRHVVSENRRVLEAREALENGKLDRLGRLISRSHVSLRDDYEVSCEELDRLVDIALGCNGVLGSRMMGAGFGGCTISLVREEDVKSVAGNISEEYERFLGREPWMHVAAPSDAVKSMG
jgi:galactokinase